MVFHVSHVHPRLGTAYCRIDWAKVENPFHTHELPMVVVSVTSASYRNKNLHPVLRFADSVPKACHIRAVKLPVCLGLEANFS